MAEGEASTQGPGALAGLKVIDLTRVLGGPYCTMVLSDHGAEVIKLEPPQGDEPREWGPPFDDAGDASYSIGINRNKKSVATCRDLLDAATMRGRRYHVKSNMTGRSAKARSTARSGKVRASTTGSASPTRASWRRE